MVALLSSELPGIRISRQSWVSARLYPIPAQSIGLPAGTLSIGAASVASASAFRREAVPEAASIAEQPSALEANAGTALRSSLLSSLLSSPQSAPQASEALATSLQTSPVSGTNAPAPDAPLAPTVTWADLGVKDLDGPSAADDMLAVAALEMGKANEACLSEEYMRLPASAKLFQVPLALVHDLPEVCASLREFGPLVSEARVALPEESKNFHSSDHATLRVLLYLQELRSTGRLPRYALVLDFANSVFGGHPLAYLRAASSETHVFVQQSWVMLKQKLKAATVLTSWNATAALARKDDQLLNFEAWGGFAALVLELLSRVLVRLRTYTQEQTKAGGGFAVLLADSVAGGGGLPALTVLGDFANTDAGQRHYVFQKPKQSDSSEDRSSCWCERRHDLSLYKTVEAQMQSSDGVRWGPARKDMNIQPYYAIGRLPVTCHGCTNMTVFNGAAPVPLVSRTVWPKATVAKVRHSSLLVLTVVLGKCEEDYQKRLLQSTQSFNISLMILHDQPECRWLTKDIPPLAASIAVDANAFMHLQAPDRRYAFIAEFVEILDVTGYSPTYLMIVDADDVVFSGSPLPAFTAHANNSNIFVQEEWTTLSQNPSRLALFQAWNVNFGAKDKERRLLNFGAWGGLFSNVIGVIEGLSMNLNKAKNSIRVDAPKASPGTLAFLNQIVRMPWSHIVPLTDFMNIYTGKNYDISFEEASDETGPSCLCARSQVSPNSPAPSFGPLAALAVPRETPHQEISADLARAPVTCRGCRQMSVFHRASPKR